MRASDVLANPIIGGVAVRVVYVLIAFAAPLSAIALPLVLLARRIPPGKAEFQIPLFVSLAALSCFVASLGRPDFHHLLTALPPALLTFGYCISSCDSTRVFRYSGRALSAAVLAAALWVCAAAVVSALHTRVVGLGSPLGFLASYSDDEDEGISLSPVEKLLLFLKTSTHANEKIFVMPSSPFLYYLSERENATRFPMLMSSLNDENQMEEVIEELRRANPRIVILDPLSDWEQYRAALPYASLQDFQRNSLLKYIYGNYRVKERYGGFTVLEFDEEGNLR
jgi:hypothetical protein